MPVDVGDIGRRLCGARRVDEFDADGDDAEGFAFGGIDLADVGELTAATVSWANMSSKLA